MAAECRVKIIVEADGLGPGVIPFTEYFTDENTPEDYRRFDTAISSTAILLSALVNIPSSEIFGLAIRARGGDIYLNTISTTISTKGTYVPDGQSQYLSFFQGNGCKITMLGEAATEVTGLLFADTVT